MINNNIRKTIYKFKQFRSIFDIDTLKVIYYSLFVSIINNGILIRVVTNGNHLNRLKITQKWIKNAIQKLSYENQQFYLHICSLECSDF